MLAGECQRNQAEFETHNVQKCRFDPQSGTLMSTVTTQAVSKRCRPAHDTRQSSLEYPLRRSQSAANPASFEPSQR